jgi:RNA polymerase sigma factor (sigma-70 family)
VHIDFDDNLVRLLLSGDRKTISTFVETYGQFIYNVCYKILLHNQLAEEATQDSIMKILKSIESFDTKSSFKAWCYTIAYRTAIDSKRKLKSHVDLATSPEPIYDRKADFNIDELETKEGINSLLRHLDEESRVIVSLFYLEEKSIKEVLDITGLTESNVKIKLFRARKELAKHANKYFDNAIN